MNLSRTAARKKIEEYFSRQKLQTDETKKIKKLAMAHRIRLGEYRKRFCKSCYSDLSNGKVRITESHKIVTCGNCKSITKIRIF